tara:strand:- start:145 stop:453 length:309 start_codon:yes stop_codon:yes gene_type:complete
MIPKPAIVEKPSEYKKYKSIYLNVSGKCVRVKDIVLPNSVRVCVHGTFPSLPGLSCSLGTVRRVPKNHHTPDSTTVHLKEEAAAYLCYVVMVVMVVIVVMEL